MGRIDRIEVEDFKSYAGQQTLGPFKDFTAIIGPNGAGKSNVMDAICFVLGLPPKSIRAGKLQDLIFRVEGQVAKAKKARVAMVYITSEGEVENIAAGTELVFERTVTSSGVSAFKVGGHAVDHDDYSAALFDIGIDVKSRNFLVFQGDTATIAGKNPKEMLDYFETFSGSAELKGPYEETQRVLEDLRRDFNTKSNTRRLVITERKQAKQQKDEADRYAAAQAELGKLKTTHKMMQLYYLDQDISTKETSLVDAARRLEEATGKEESMATQWAELGKAAASAAQRKGKLSSQMQSKTKDAREKDEKVQQLKDAVDNLRKSLGGASGEEKKAADAVTTCEAEVESLESEVSKVDFQLKQLSSGSGSSSSSSSSSSGDVEMDSGAGAGSKRGKGKKDTAGAGAGSSVTIADADRGEYNQLKATERQKTADQREQLERLQLQQDGDESERAKQRGNFDAAKSRLEQLEQQTSQQKERRDGLAKALLDSQAALKVKQEELAAHRKELEIAVKRQEQLGGELEAVKAELSQYSMAKSKSDTEKRMEAACEDMKRLFNGVRGRIVDLVEPISKKYQVAVSITLGRHADAVVVDTEAAAIDCVKWLRDNKVRPMTFLPLDTLRPKEIGDDVLAAVSDGRSRYQLAKNVLKCQDESLDRAIDYVCGATIVCDKLEDAMDLRYKRGVEAKIVTIDGSVVARNGNITGGQGDRDEAVGRAARWDEKSSAQATAVLNKLLAEEDGFRRRLARHRGANDSTSLHSLIESVAGEIKVADQRITMITKTIDSHDTNIANFKKDADACRSEVKSSEAAMADVTKRIDARAVEINKLKASIADVTDSVFASFSSRLGLTSIRDYENQVVERQAAESKQRAALTEQREKLKSKLDFEKRKLADAQKALDRVRKEGSDSGGKLAGLEKELQAAQSKLSEAQAAADALRAQLAEASEAEKASAAKKEELAKQREAVNSEKAARQKDVSVAEIALEKLRSDRHKALSDARMDNIALPVKVDADADTTAGNKKGSKKASTKSKSKGRGSTGGGVSESKGDDDDEEMDEDDDGAGRNNATMGVFSQTLTDSQMHGGTTGEGSTASTAHFSQGEDSVVQRDQRRSDRIDYDRLESKYRSLDAAQRVKEEGRLSDAIASKASELSSLNPNMRAVERFTEVEARYAAAEKEAEGARLALAETETKFSSIKRKREKALRNAFERVRAVIDTIYKDLTRDAGHAKGGSASLELIGNDVSLFDSSDAGIRFTVIPPAKRFREMDQYSGGEKALASMALLFSLQSCSPSPFFIMDEIDAPWDNANVGRVANYVRRRATQATGDGMQPPLQCIVISLKDSFYCKANGIVGIYKDSTATCSRSMTLEMTQYDYQNNGGDGSSEAPSTPGSHRSGATGVTSSGRYA